MIPERRKPEQVSEITGRLDRLQQDCEALLESVRVNYGAEDERTARAQELCNDLQRLRLALSRGNSKSIHRVDKGAKGT